MRFSSDPDLYTTIPTRKPADTLSLTRALIVAADPNPSPPVAARLARIEDRGKQVQAAWIEAHRPPEPGTTAHDADVADNRSWSVLRSRIEHWTFLADPERGPAAARISALLFPDGLSFLNLPFAEQWAEGQRRLALIDAEPSLAAQLADLVDPRILARLREHHGAYGDALAITRERQDRGDPASVHVHVEALRTELAGYARLILGLTDEHDPEAVAAAEAQLEPILRFRAAKQAAQAGGAAPDASPEGGAEAGPGAGAVIEPVEVPLPPAPLS